MKIMALYEGVVGKNSDPGMLVWPDSAFIRNKKPVFLPDEEYSIFFGILMKIDRLGKSVSTKFAGRYYSQMAPMSCFVTQRNAKRIFDGEDAYASELVADCAVICGDFIPTEDLPSDAGMTISMSDLYPSQNASETPQEDTKGFLIEDIRSTADRNISFASRRNTLKTGDLVGFLVRDSVARAERDKVVKVSLDGKTLLEYKLK